MSLVRFLFIILFLVLAGVVCADTGGDIADEINDVICLFVQLIWLVTGSLMALVIIFAGVKWLVSGEDAGARASAKTFIISAFVGLIVIFTAVPVVDYLVGGMLGYEFRCGFFPEVDSGALNALHTQGSGEEVLGPMSVNDPVDNPLSSYPDLYLSSVSLSGEVGSGDDLSVCFVVGEETGSASVEDVSVSVYLVDEGGNYVEACSTSIPFIDAHTSKEAACSLDSELLEEIREDPGAYVLEARVDSSDSVLELVEGDNNVMSSGLEDVPVEVGCDEKLGVLSDNMVAVIYAGNRKNNMVPVECCGRIDAYVGEPVYLDGFMSTSWKGCPIIKYIWLVDDQVVYESASSSHELVFNSPGTHSISLEITADGGKYTYIRDSGRCARIIVSEKPAGAPEKTQPAETSGEPVALELPEIDIPLPEDFIILSGTDLADLRDVNELTVNVGDVVYFMMYGTDVEERKSMTYATIEERRLKEYFFRWKIDDGSFESDINEAAKNDALISHVFTGPGVFSVRGDFETFDGFAIACYGHDTVTVRVIGSDPAPSENALSLAVVPMGYNFPEDRDLYDADVTRIRNAWLRVSPFRECPDKENRFVTIRIYENCPEALAAISNCNPGLSSYFSSVENDALRDCIYKSEHRGCCHYIMALYKGNFHEDFGCDFNGLGGLSATVGHSISGGPVRIAIHELGHVSGLAHCQNLCVMSSGGSYFTEFCNHCYILLKNNLRTNTHTASSVEGCFD